MNATDILGEILGGGKGGGIFKDIFGKSAPSRPAQKEDSSASADEIARQARELEDMIGVVGQSFLGLTINCARCHSHKFDPIPHEEYYQIKSVFEGVKHGERSIATKEEIEAREYSKKELQRELDLANQTILRIESEGAKLASAKRPAGLP